MTVNYGIKEVRLYRVVREYDDGTTGGTESCGEFSNLEQAELAAKLLSGAETGAGWYTVPERERHVTDIEGVPCPECGAVKGHTSDCWLPF